MKKKIAEKWVAALRNGNYKQTTYTYYQEEDNSYCCLGVLCELLNNYHKGMVKKIAGFVEGPDGSPTWSLFLDYNDAERLTFAEIADKIEADWDGI